MIWLVQAAPEEEEFFSMEVEAAPKPTAPAKLAEDQFPVPCTLSSLGAAASGGALGFVVGFGMSPFRPLCIGSSRAVLAWQKILLVKVLTVAKRRVCVPHRPAAF